MTSYVDATPQKTVHADHHNTLDAATKSNASAISSLKTRMTAQESRSMIPGPAGADGARGPQGDPGPRGAASTVPGPAGADGLDGVVSKLTDAAGADVTAPTIGFGPGLVVQPPSSESQTALVSTEVALAPGGGRGKVLTLDDQLKLQWAQAAPITPWVPGAAPGAVQQVGGQAFGVRSVAEGNGAAQGVSSHAEGFGTAAGDYSHAEGRGLAVGDYSHACGAGVASRRGSWAHSSGGGGKRTLTGLARTTSDATKAELTVGGLALTAVSGQLNVLDVNAKAAVRFRADIVGLRTDGTVNSVAAYTIEGMAAANAAGTVRIVSQTVTTITEAGSATWAVAAEVATSPNRIAFKVTGAPGATISWYADVQSTEVGQ